MNLKLPIYLAFSLFAGFTARGDGGRLRAHPGWTDRPCMASYAEINGEGRITIRVPRELYAELQSKLNEGDGLTAELDELGRGHRLLKTRLDALAATPTRDSLASVVADAWVHLSHPRLDTLFDLTHQRVPAGTNAFQARNVVINAVTEGVTQRLESFRFLSEGLALTPAQWGAHSAIAQDLERGAERLRAAVTAGSELQRIRAFAVDLSVKLENARAWCAENAAASFQTERFLTATEKSRETKELTQKIQENRSQFGKLEQEFVEVNSNLVDLTDYADAALATAAFARVQRWTLRGAGGLAVAATVRALVLRQTEATQRDK